MTMENTTAPILVSICKYWQKSNGTTHVAIDIRGLGGLNQPVLIDCTSQVYRALNMTYGDDWEKHCFVTEQDIKRADYRELAKRAAFIPLTTGSTEALAEIMKIMAN